MSSPLGHQMSRQERLDQVYNAGARAAEGRGLQPVDCDACGLDFQVHMLHGARLERWGRTGFSEGWLRKCAARFATDALIAWLTVMTRELGGPGAEIEIEEQVDAQSDVEHDVVAEEVHRELVAAVSALRPGQRRVVVRNYYNAFPCFEPAGGEAVSPKAAAMRLTRARRNLASILAACSFDADEALRLLNQRPTAQTAAVCEAARRRRVKQQCLESSTI